MSIQIYHSLTRRKEPLETVEPGVVRMYVCGVTVYDDAHIGHAMSAIVFDIVRRYLEYRGYRVNHVVNFTDVEDNYTATRALLLGAAGTFWASRFYGLGGGVMLGYGDFFAKQWHGWDDETMVLAPFITPVRLRFGANPEHQLALDAVLTWFTSRSVAVPYGRISYTMVF